MLARSYAIERSLRVRRLRARGWRDSAPPIVVHQMGKVGSSSVTAAIAARHAGRVDHVHHLAPDAIEREEALYRAAFHERRKIDGHLVHSINLRREIDRGDLDPDAKIISLVREPMSWRISSFFQTLSFRVPNLRERCAADDISSLADEVTAQFHGDGWWHEDRIWSFFAAEFAPVWDIDVFAAPFNFRSGWQEYHGGRRPALVGRYEDLGATGELAVGDFVGIADLRLPRHQVTQDSYYEGLVAAVHERISFSPDYLERAYEADGVGHLYSASERDDFPGSGPQQADAPCAVRAVAFGT